MNDISFAGAKCTIGTVECTYSLQDYKNPQKRGKISKPTEIQTFELDLSKY